MEIYGGNSSSFFYLGRYKRIARVIGKIPYYKKIAVHHFFKQLYYRKGSRYMDLIYEFTYEDADSVDWSTANFIWNCYPLNYSVSHNIIQIRKKYFDETDHAFRDPRWRVMLLNTFDREDEKLHKPIMSRRYMIPLKTYQSINIKWES